MLYGNSPVWAFMSSGDPMLMNLSDDKGNDGKGLSSDNQPADVVNMV